MRAEESSSRWRMSRGNTFCGRRSEHKGREQERGYQAGSSETPSPRWWKWVVQRWRRKGEEEQWKVLLKPSFWFAGDRKIGRKFLVVFCLWKGIVIYTVRKIPDTRSLGLHFFFSERFWWFDKYQIKIYFLQLLFFYYFMRI